MRFSRRIIELESIMDISKLFSLRILYIILHDNISPSVKTLETVFLVTEPEFSHISSTIVRDIIRNNGNVEQFLPNAVTL